MSQLEVIDACRQVATTDEVEPLLHLVLILEPCTVALALGSKEHIEVKLIELALLGHLLYLIGHAVGEHHHAWQREVRVTASFPFGLGTLLVRVGPVEYLLLDELTIVDGAERRSREEEIILRRDGQPSLVDGIARLVLLIFLGIEVHCILLVLLLEELLGTLLPCTKVILIEDYQVPSRGVDKLILCLDAATLVRTQQVLERTEHHDRPRLVGSLKLLVDVQVVVLGILV